MSRGGFICALALVVGLAGCGSDDDSASCEALLRDRAAGTCHQDGRELVVAKPRGSAELDELRVELDSWIVIDLIETRLGRVEADPLRLDGAENAFRFAVASVGITNLTDRPRLIGTPHRHARLTFRGQTYDQDAAVLDGVARPESFYDPIRRGATVERKLIFKISYDVSEQLREGGAAIEVANFSAPNIDLADQVAVLPLGTAR